MIEYIVTKNGVLVEGRQLLLWGVLMLPFGASAGIAALVGILGGSA